MLFLAQILNRPVIDAAGVRLGWVEDLVLTGVDHFPTVSSVVLARRGKGVAFIPWASVDYVNHGVHLQQTQDEINTITLQNDAVFLRRDILDKQIVDINGRKVVRVNDLQLANIDSELRLIGADIGLRGILRRLNLERPANAIARGFNSQLPTSVIPWSFVEGLETEWPAVRLNVSHRRLRNLPATDIADILSQLHPIDRDELVTHIDDETLADMLPHLEDDIQAEMISAMSDQRASDIMEFLPPDEAADVLGDLDEEHAERILHLMEKEEAEDVRELLQYEDDTAGGLMTPAFISLPDDLLADQAMAVLRREAPDAETVYYVYIVDAERRLEGVLSLRDLITAESDTPISELVRRDVISVKVTDDQETVAHVLNHYHLLAVPVVDDKGELLGIVTFDDVLDVLHEEAEEDISRQAGEVEESDVLATPWEQVSLRLPWALAAALSGMLVAIYFALSISGTALPITLLAVLPLLIFLGVQIGGQAATATQVALHNGESVAEIVYELSQRQWPIGLALSALGAIVSGGVSWGVSGYNHALPVAAVVWLVLLLDMFVGSLLPLVLHKLKWDPILINRPALAIIAMIIGAPLLTQVLVH